MPYPKNPSIIKDKVFMIIPDVVMNVVCFTLFKDIRIDDMGDSK